MTGRVQTARGRNSPRRVLFALLAAASLAGPAAAQLPPGRSGMSSGWVASNLNALKELSIFGRCYAKALPRDILKVMATGPGTREEADTFRKLFDSEAVPCLSPGSAFHMPLPYIRGAMVEGLLLAHVAVPANLRLSAPAAADVHNLSDAARCYADGHIAQARAVLATEVGSRAEYEAVNAVMADFATCLPSAPQIHVNATLVRYRLAEALIRLAPASGS